MYEGSNPTALRSQCWLVESLAALMEETARCVGLFADRFARKDRPEYLLVYGKALLSGALAQLVICWFSQEDPIPVEELAGVVRDFYRGNLFQLAERG